MFLIKSGADLNIQCNNGKNAFDYASARENKAIIKAIIDAKSINGFTKHDDHNVFTCQDIPYLEVSIKRVFNFQANEMTRITAAKSETKIETFQFRDIDLSGVAKAAEALEKMGGSPGQSWRNPNFHQKPSQVSLKGKNCG